MSNSPLVGQTAGTADGVPRLLRLLLRRCHLLEHHRIGEDDHLLCPIFKDVDSIFGAGKEDRIQLFDHMGFIGAVRRGDHPPQKGRNPLLLHNLGRVVLMAVEDDLLALFC